MKSKFLLSTLLCSSGLFANEIIQVDVPMHNQGASTFYVNSTIEGSEECMMLVDTGSGHSVINEITLKNLKSSGNARFIKNLQGMMADGSTTIVPLYTISAITIGDSCTIKDVQAAVLPNNSRQILGISTLQKAAPFGLSFDPPTLTLSGCSVNDVIQAAKHSPASASTPESLVDNDLPDSLKSSPGTEKLASND